MSREMDEYGIPDEPHVSDQELWEVQQRYKNNPAQAIAAMRAMGYDGPQLDPKTWDRTPASTGGKESSTMENNNEYVHQNEMIVGGTKYPYTVPRDRQAAMARPQGRDNAMWTMPGSVRDDYVTMAQENGLDEDSLKDWGEQADFYGMESLTEDQQALLGRGNDIFDYMLETGAFDGEPNKKTGRLVEIETKGNPGKLQTMYELPPEGDTHVFLPMTSTFRSWVEAGVKGRLEVPYPCALDTTMRIDREDFTVTGVWGKDQMQGMREKAEKQLDHIDYLKALGRDVQEQTGLTRSEMSKERGEAHDSANQPNGKSEQAGNEATAKTSNLDAMLRANRETDARDAEWNGLEGDDLKGPGEQ